MLNKGSEESETMKSIFRMHIASEHTVPYPTEAICAATNELMVMYSKIGDNNPTSRSIDLVMDVIASGWMAVCMEKDSDSGSGGSAKDVWGPFDNNVGGKPEGTDSFSGAD